MKKKTLENLKTLGIVFFSFTFIGSLLNIFNSKKDDVEIKNKNFDFETYESVAKLSGGQDGAIFDNYLFSFGSYGSCNVHSMDDYSTIATFTLDKSDISSPHSNSVCFGNEYYSKDDDFPLLYSNIYNNDSSKLGTTNVYRIVKDENNTFTSELVQVIKIGFTDDSNKWATGVRPYGNCVVDIDNSDYWAFVMDGATNTTKFFKFDLPILSDGVYDSTYDCNVVTLEYENILDQFSTVYFNYVQGACYFDGRIYSTEGFTNDTTNIPTLRIIDLKEKKVIKSIDLVESYSLSIEPEFIDVYKDKLFYKDVNGNLYSFNMIEG